MKICLWVILEMLIMNPNLKSITQKCILAVWNSSWCLIVQDIVHFLRLIVSVISYTLARPVVAKVWFWCRLDFKFLTKKNSQKSRTKKFFNQVNIDISMMSWRLQMSMSRYYANILYYLVTKGGVIPASGRQLIGGVNTHWGGIGALIPRVISGPP